MLTKNKIVLTLSLVLLGSFFLLIYLIYQNQTTNLQKQKTTETQTETIIETTQKTTYPTDLKGTVYLSLKEKEESRTKDIQGIFSFDLAKKEFKEEHFVEEQPILGGEMDPKGEKMLVTMSFPGQIQIMDKNKNIEKVTVSESFKKEAVWSSDGSKIAFMSEKENSTAFDINSWNIVVSDLNGNEEKISTGAHPFFSPNGEKILFLKENGLNLIDIKTKEEENVLNFEADPTFQLDLSLDKDRLVFSDSLDGTINIFKINSWDNFKLEKTQEIEIPYSSISWPKFSPYDNKYLIYEEFFEDGTIKIAAFDIENSQRYPILDLTAYEHNHMWINDWR